MKCLIVQPIHRDGLRLLREAGIEPVMAPATDGASLAASVAGCDAVIIRNAAFSAEAFAGADKLQVVVVHGTGHDAVDKEAAAEKGVLVANTPGANARSVAELALGLTLALARGLTAADRWERAGTAGFRESRSFSELEGKTALIVGWGAIGSRFGRMLDAALGMRVLVYSPNATDTAPFERVTASAPVSALKTAGVAADEAGAGRASASRTSSAWIRPRGPVPVREWRSTPSLAAIARAAGVARTLSPSESVSLACSGCASSADATGSDFSCAAAPACGSGSALVSASPPKGAG